MEVKSIMTRKEAAEYMGICLASFAKIQHKIKCIRLGRSIRFRKIDIDAFLEEEASKV